MEHVVVHPICCFLSPTDPIISCDPTAVGHTISIPLATTAYESWMTSRDRTKYQDFQSVTVRKKETELFTPQQFLLVLMSWYVAYGIAKIFSWKRQRTPECTCYSLTLTFQTFSRNQQLYLFTLIKIDSFIRVYFKQLRWFTYIR